MHKNANALRVFGKRLGARLGDHAFKFHGPLVRPVFRFYRVQSCAANRCRWRVMAPKIHKPKVPYLPESEICDMAWRDRATFEPFAAGWDPHVLHREFDIAYGLRPDFLQIGLWYGRPTIWIHEFKVSANLYAIDQIARYRRVVHEHADEISMYLWREKNIMTRTPDVNCSLIATGFDRFVYEVADAMNVWLWRLTLTEDGYELEQDSNPSSVAAGTSQIDGRFLPRLLDAGLNDLIPAMAEAAKEPSNG